MDALRIILALAASALAPTGTLAAQSSLSFPPPIDDPQSGPFFVRLDAHGGFGADQDGVIANAANVWSANSLRAFEICYQPTLGGNDWHNATSALQPVARALKAHGAQVVVTPDGGACANDPHRSTWPGAYVKILGVAQL